MHNFLNDQFNFFDFSRTNETWLKLLRNDAESILSEHATPVTTSITIAAALVNNMKRIVRDDIPVPVPSEPDTDEQFKKFVNVVYKWLACMNLEEKGFISRTDDGWKMTEKGKEQNMSMKDMIEQEQFVEGNSSN